MFSFHKPKIYRSVNGCCICKAKSSSSRFTDSKKYEPEFEKCFRITEKRSGEICNACVLLVKRWKKLPPGTNRDWHHVVDARAGPGTKSVNKVKAKSAKLPRLVKKHKARQFVCKPVREKLSPGGLSDDITVGDDSLSESSNLSLPHSRMPSPSPSDSSENSSLADEGEDIIEQTAKITIGTKKRRRRKDVDMFGNGSSSKRHKSSAAMLRISSFLDMTFWRKERICCGIVFKGPNNEVLIYPKLLRPCCYRKSSDSRAASVGAGPRGSGGSGNGGNSDVFAAAKAFGNSNGNVLGSTGQDSI